MKLFKSMINPFINPLHCNVFAVLGLIVELFSEAHSKLLTEVMSVIEDIRKLRNRKKRGKHCQQQDLILVNFKAIWSLSCWIPNTISKSDQFSHSPTTLSVSLDGLASGYYNMLSNII